MSNNSFKSRQFKYFRTWIFGLIALTGLLSSCNSDSIAGDSIYTFVGETVTSYCESRSEFSIFSKMMKDSETDKLFSCYGHFTCFAPTDSAFNVYFQENNISLESLTKEEKKQMVFDHIVNNEQMEYLTKDFKEGALPTPNMSNNYMIISYAGFNEGNQVINVNKNSPILNKDIKLHNGVIHVVGKVIRPSSDFLLDVIKQQSYFNIFAEAMELTHLGDSIKGIYDDTYVSPVGLSDYNGNGVRVPKYRKYGYTIFAESDSVFHNNTDPIYNVADLVAYAQKYYGTEDANDYTSRNNALNKFISYHMLNRSLSTNSILYSGGCTVASFEDQKYEYYETFLKYRMIEFKSGNKLNVQSNGQYVGIEDFKSNLLGVNGFVHTLNRVLVYDENVMQDDVLNKRIRFDCYSVAPQLTNNNIRWKLVNSDSYTITPDYCGEYFKFNSACNLTMWASEGWHNYQADEMILNGWYDFSLQMLPVPPGTYEIRMGYRAEDWRGIAQLFIDGNIVGIPVNLSLRGTDPSVGWIDDGVTDDEGVENDKMMRNRGYMKGPSSVLAWNGVHTLRQDNMTLRIIIGTFTFQNYGYHYFRAKNVENEFGAFHFDYIEYVPTSYIDKEGKD